MPAVWKAVFAGSLLNGDCQGCASFDGLTVNLAHVPQGTNIPGTPFIASACDWAAQIPNVFCDQRLFGLTMTVYLDFQFPSQWFLNVYAGFFSDAIGMAQFQCLGTNLFVMHLNGHCTGTLNCTLSPA